MSLKENLQILRKSNHLSQEQLAEKVGVSRQSVSKWENGEAYPEMPNILALCTIFHCRIIDLIDINSEEFANLDPKSQKDVIDLTKKDRNRLKFISKTIYILARIARYLSLSSFIIIDIVSWALHWAAFNWMVSDMPETSTFSDINFVNFFKYGLFPKVLVMILIVGLFIIASIYLYKLLHEIERFFKSIYKNKSPFTVENTISLKKISRFIVIWLVTDNLAKIIFSITFPRTKLSISLFSIIFALITMSFVYIFRYGHILENTPSKQ